MSTLIKVREQTTNRSFFLYKMKESSTLLGGVREESRVISVF